MKDVTEYDLLSEALNRQSLQMMDNLGLRTSVTTLDSYPIEQLIEGVLYGENVVTRFWAQKIRPRVFKRRQAMIEDAYKRIINISRKEFVGRAMNNANEIVR